MKKILTILTTLFIITSCINSPKLKSDTEYGYSVIEIDSCEYLYASGVKSHKGNCIYCKERRKKELTEILKQFKNN